MRIFAILLLLTSSHLYAYTCANVVSNAKEVNDKGLNYSKLGNTHYNYAMQFNNNNQVAQACNSMGESYRFYVASKISFVACADYIKLAQKICTGNNQTTAVNWKNHCQNSMNTINRWLENINTFYFPRCTNTLTCSFILTEGNRYSQNGVKLHTQGHERFKKARNFLQGGNRTRACSEADAAYKETVLALHDYLGCQYLFVWGGKVCSGTEMQTANTRMQSCTVNRAGAERNRIVIQDFIVKNCKLPHFSGE